MKLTPPSSAISVTIMSRSIYLAGLAYRETSLTSELHSGLKIYQSDKISPTYPPTFDTKKPATHPL